MPGPRETYVRDYLISKSSLFDFINSTWIIYRTSMSELKVPLHTNKKYEAYKKMNSVSKFFITLMGYTPPEKMPEEDAAEEILKEDEYEDNDEDGDILIDDGAEIEDKTCLTGDNSEIDNLKDNT